MQMGIVSMGQVGRSENRAEGPAPMLFGFYDFVTGSNEK